LNHESVLDHWPTAEFLIGQKQVGIVTVPVPMPTTLPLQFTSKFYTIHQSADIQNIYYTDVPREKTEMERGKGIICISKYNLAWMLSD